MDYFRLTEVHFYMFYINNAFVEATVFLFLISGQQQADIASRYSIIIANEFVDKNPAVDIGAVAEACTLRYCRTDTS